MWWWKKNKSKKLFILTLFVSVFTFASFAQTDAEINEQSGWKERVYTGGGVGAGFGNVVWVQVAPLVGYRITNKFSAGIGVNYRYANYTIFTPKITTNDIGTSVFARYSIKPPFFAQVEYERLNYERINILDFSKTRRGNNAFLIGGGMWQPVGRNTSFTVIALYNALYQPGDLMSPYTSPWIIRAGVNVGF